MVQRVVERALVAARRVARVARDGSYGLRALPFPDGAVFYVFERIGADRAANLPR